MEGKKIIFLISLPRSGSTLLQKMLTVSPEIYSVAEPWLMLPLAFMLKKEGDLNAIQPQDRLSGAGRFNKRAAKRQNRFLSRNRKFLILPLRENGIGKIL